MAETKTNVFTDKDMAIVKKGLELLIASYSRAQTQRPEFAEIAKQYEEEVTDLLRKIK